MGLDPKILAIIPARGGSKGIPRKNLRNLAGKPLISYAIRTLLASTYDIDVYVSSEDEEILSIARKLGAETHKRPETLSTDKITLDPVVYEAFRNIQQLKEYDYELVLTCQPTSPLLKSSSIDAAITRLLTDKKIDCVLSGVEKRGLTWSKSNEKFVPNFTERLNRQQLEPTFYETGGFFISRSQFVTPTSRFGNNVSIYVLDEKEGIDIDDTAEWNLCAYFLKRKRILFNTIGYPEIGTGHIYRCLLLADHIVNHEIIFLVDRKSDLGYSKISSANFSVHRQDHDDILDDILQIKPDLVINDCLDTSASFILGIKKHGIRVINYEDLGSGSNVADLTINALYEKEERTNVKSGHEFFCARNEFLLSGYNEIRKDANQVLLTFGGTDPNNLTQKVLDAIYPVCMDQKIRIKIILGMGYMHRNSFVYSPEVEILEHVHNMSDHMLDADIVFTSAGRTVYELAIVGSPSIVLAQNERELLHSFASEENGFLHLGPGDKVSAEEIRNAFHYFLNQEERVKRSLKMKDRNLRGGIFRNLQLINQILDYEEH